MNVSIYMKEEYEDFHAFVRRKNKPNSKPITGLWPEIRSSKSEIRRLRLCSRTPIAPCRSGNNEERVGNDWD